MHSCMLDGIFQGDSRSMRTYLQRLNDALRHEFTHPHDHVHARIHAKVKIPIVHIECGVSGVCADVKFLQPHGKGCYVMSLL